MVAAGEGTKISNFKFEISDALVLTGPESPTFPSGKGDMRRTDSTENPKRIFVSTPNGTSPMGGAAEKTAPDGWCERFDIQRPQNDCRSISATLVSPAEPT